MSTKKQLLAKVKRLNSERKYKEVNDLLIWELLDQYKDASLYAEKAGASWDTNQYEDCQKAVNQSLLLDKQNAKALNNQGNLYWLVKDYEKAEKYYLKALETDPDYAASYNGLGIIYHNQKDYSKEEEYYLKALEIDSNYAHAYRNLGILYYDQKEYSKAKEYYLKAIEVDSNYASAYNSLGFLHYDQKEYSKAEEYYLKAIEVDSGYAAPNFNLGLLYKVQEQNEQALEHFNRYLQLETDEYWIARTNDHIDEIKKRLSSKDYSDLSPIIGEIKSLLAFDRECVTHYTSLTLSQKIVLEDSPFRISEGSFLNDTSEGRELFKILPSIEDIHKGDETIAKAFRKKLFIGSFVSEIKHDDLALWRMYGKEREMEARGVAITFQGQEFISSFLGEGDGIGSKEGGAITDDEDFSLYRVAYVVRDANNKFRSFSIPGLPKKKESELKKMMNRLHEELVDFMEQQPSEEDKSIVLERVNEIAYLFKSADYQYEQEVRLIVKGIYFDKHIDSSLENQPPRVYIKLNPLGPFISKITLGPKVDRAEEWAAAFHYHLDKTGSTPEVLISRLPFK